jgi:predicted transcriptional regulator
MSSITNQLIINKFCIPKEIIEIIKEYVFTNIINRTKKNKNKIISLINETRISPKNYNSILKPLAKTEWLFCINENYKSIQYHSSFCIECGDYLNSYTEYALSYKLTDEEYNKLERNIMCKCL